MSRLNVMFWNAQGMWSKKRELYEFLGEEYIDIACICETHFSDKTGQINFPGYNIVRQDRPTHMGGLLTLVKEGIPFRTLTTSPTSLLEHIPILINNNMVIINTYLPGSARRSDIQEHLINDLDCLTKINNYGLFIVGDLNAKNTAWNNDKNNYAGKIINNYLIKNKLTVSFPASKTYVPMSSKKSSSTIDIILSNNKIHHSRPYVINTFTSDHVPVLFGIDSSWRDKTPIRLRPNMHKANWKKFRYELNNDLISTVLPFNPLMNEEAIDKVIDQITRSTKTAFDSCVPKERTTSTGIFITEDIAKLLNKRNYHRRRWLRAHKTADRALYYEYKKQISLLLNIEYRNKVEMEMKSCAMGDNKIYKLIKNRRRSKMPNLKVGQTTCYSAKDKTEALADYFRKMHDNPLSKTDMLFTRGVESKVKELVNQDLLNVKEIKSVSVYNIIKELKKGKAPGPDGISVGIIKNFSFIAIEILTGIINVCFRLGYFPNSWKHAKTIAVPKSGKDPHNLTSYRPIALLNIFSKIFEKIINTELRQIQINNNLLPDFQFGFRSGHSTNHALTIIHKDLSTALKDKKTTGVLAFDIEKAFDRVWHAGLIYKMHRQKFPIHLIRLIHSFLTERTFAVYLDQDHSLPKDIPWGVPQGSAISPTLYNVFISDFPTSTDPSIREMLYADDTLIYISNRNINTITQALTATATNIFKFYNKWKIKINTNKTTLTCFTRRTSKQLPSDPIVIEGTNIPWTDDFKYLGITFDKRLTLTKHTNNCCSKVDAAIRCLYPYINRNSKLDSHLKIHLYKTYIRPLLCYGPTILLSMNKTTWKKFETKQNKCLRMLLDVKWDSFTSNHEVLLSCKTSPLVDHVQRLTDSFINKCKDSNNRLIRNMY